VNMLSSNPITLLGNVLYLTLWIGGAGLLYVSLIRSTKETSLTRVQLTLLTIYRLTLHPLAKYPGPLSAKITDWYSVYHAWKGDRHLEFHRCHEKYGPVFRFGPNSLSFNTASALKTIYGHKSNVQKSKFYSVFPPTKDTFNTHSSIDKASHSRKRRVLSHAFSDTAIKSMEKYILGNIRTFALALGSKPTLKFTGAGEKGKGKGGWGKAQNMADWCNYLTFDVMGDLCFGKAFEMLEREENRHVIDLIGSAAHMHLIVSLIPFFSITCADGSSWAQTPQSKPSASTKSSSALSTKKECNTWPTPAPKQASARKSAWIPIGRISSTTS
jgi:hypothetical protein